MNNPNDWGVKHGDSSCIVGSVRRIVTVSVETVHIVQSLPALRYRRATA